MVVVLDAVVEVAHFLHVSKGNFTEENVLLRLLKVSFSVVVVAVVTMGIVVRLAKHVSEVKSISKQVSCL